MQHSCKQNGYEQTKNRIEKRDWIEVSAWQNIKSQGDCTEFFAGDSDRYAAIVASLFYKKWIGDKSVGCTVYGSVCHLRDGTGGSGYVESLDRVWTDSDFVDDSDWRTWIYYHCSIVFYDYFQILQFLFLFDLHLKLSRS